MDVLQETVLRLSEQGLSINEISRRTKVSSQKVRKILITAGAWSSPLSERINAMLNDDMSVDDISKELGMTRNAVLSYIPYSRGMQNAEYPSVNALKIRKCRAKKAK